MVWAEYVASAAQACSDVPTVWFDMEGAGLPDVAGGGRARGWPSLPGSNMEGALGRLLQQLQRLGVTGLRLPPQTSFSANGSVGGPRCFRRVTWPRHRPLSAPLPPAAHAAFAAACPTCTTGPLTPAPCAGAQVGGLPVPPSDQSLEPCGGGGRRVARILRPNGALLDAHARRLLDPAVQLPTRAKRQR